MHLEEKAINPESSDVVEL